MKKVADVSTKPHQRSKDALLEDADGLRREALHGIERAMLGLQALGAAFEEGADDETFTERFDEVAHSLRSARSALDAQPSELVELGGGARRCPVAPSCGA